MSIGPFNTDRISRVTTIMLCIVVGITAGLLIYSAVCPPPGHISESVYDCIPWAFALCVLFVVREAIKEGLGVKYTHGDTILEIDTDDNNK